MDKLLDKALSTGISIAGGLVATKIFEFTWRQATGEQPPKRGEDDDFTLTKALVFAVSSATISAVVQVLSQRGARAGTRKLKQAYGKQSEV